MSSQPIVKVLLVAFVSVSSVNGDESASALAPPNLLGADASTMDSADTLEDEATETDRITNQEVSSILLASHQTNPCPRCDKRQVKPCGCEKSSCQSIASSSQRESFVSLEFMSFWNRGQDIPTLVAAGNGLPPNPALFGGAKMGDEFQAGIRTTMGIWLDEQQDTALVARGFFSGGAGSEYFLESDGSTAFAIPFIDDSSNVLTNGLPDAFILSDTGLLQAGVPASVRAETNNRVAGFDAFVRKRYREGCGYRVDWLIGYQFSDIEDDVTLQTSTNRVGGGNPIFETFDQFDAENQFHGGQLGFLVERSRGIVTTQVLAKIGLGNMHQDVSIRGTNTVNGTTTGGGIFAQDQSTSGGPTFNIGDYERDTFAFSPELNLNVIVCLTENVDLTLGYTFLYWSDVLLAGEQIDTRVNRDVLFDGAYIAGGGNGPSFAFNDTDFWSHAFNVGLLMNY